jgi:hypothetical protein
MDGSCAHRIGGRLHVAATILVLAKFNLLTDDITRMSLCSYSQIRLLSFVSSFLFCYMENKKPRLLFGKQGF